MAEPLSLTSQGAPDSATLWRALLQLVESVGAALEGNDVIDDCLDVVVELLGADRGAVLLEQDDGSTAVIHARGARKKLAPGEQEEVSRTLVRQALESGCVVICDKTTRPVDSSSVTVLDIHAALVAPLRGRGVPRGVLYVDFRHPLKHVEAAHQEFFMAAVVLIGGMFEQNALARAATERLGAAQTHFTESRQTPPLEELLRPRSMARLRDDAALVLAGDSPVLIAGESGSGKTLLAHALAEASGRRPIVRIVLGGSDDLNTIASELFGHERGAFSGATSKRVGLVEYADGGTVILDEVLNLPLQAQQLLLDFTQFGTYRPLGYDKPAPKRSSVRVIAATNGDLDVAIQQGRFREDLYYRLAGVTLRIPPLRERCEDIPALAESTLRRLDASRPWTLSLEVRRHLASGVHAWPGNVRELEWVVRRARDRALARHEAATEIGSADFGDAGDRPGPLGARRSPRGREESTATQWRRLQELKAEADKREVELLREALERHDGVVAHAAKELGIARTTLAGRAQSLRLTTRKT
jgi:transcriptional regulator with GAF, ATPase, and Fis domain